MIRLVIYIAIGHQAAAGQSFCHSFLRILEETNSAQLVFPVFFIQVHAGLLSTESVIYQGILIFSAEGFIGRF
jgi:hypothetical protein